MKKYFEHMWELSWKSIYGHEQFNNQGRTNIQNYSDNELSQIGGEFPLFFKYKNQIVKAISYYNNTGSYFCIDQSGNKIVVPVSDVVKMNELVSYNHVIIPPKFTYLFTDDIREATHIFFIEKYVLYFLDTFYLEDDDVMVEEVNNFLYSLQSKKGDSGSQWSSSVNNFVPYMSSFNKNVFSVIKINDAYLLQQGLMRGQFFSTKDKYVINMLSFLERNGIWVMGGDDNDNNSDSYYHGTSSKNIISILRSGLYPRANTEITSKNFSNSPENLVSITTDLDGAKWYAANAADKADKAHGYDVIIEIYPSYIDKNYLFMDYDYYNRFIKKGTDNDYSKKLPKIVDTNGVVKLAYSKKILPNAFSRIFIKLMGDDYIVNLGIHNIKEARILFDKIDKILMASDSDKKKERKIETLIRDTDIVEYT